MIGEAKSKFIYCCADHKCKNIKVVGSHCACYGLTFKKTARWGSFEEGNIFIVLLSIELNELWGDTGTNSL